MPPLDAGQRGETLSDARMETSEGPRATKKRHPLTVGRARPCSSGSPDPDLFVIRRSQTTEVETHIVTLEIAGDRPPRYEKKRSSHRRARACPSPSFALREKRFLFSSDPNRPKTPPLDDGQRGGNPLGCAYGNLRGAPRYGKIETRMSLLLGKRNRSGCHETLLTTTIAENFACQIQEIMLKLPQCHHCHKEFACLHSISTANTSSIPITSPCRFARWK